MHEETKSEAVASAVAEQAATAAAAAAARKSVTFASENGVQEIEHINDFPEEVIAACWYRKDEIDQILNDCRKIICLVELGIPLENETQTIRGLEYATLLAAKCLVQRRRAATMAVFTEQERQRRCKQQQQSYSASTHGTSPSNNDVYKIANASVKYSWKCQTDALKKGMRDQKEIRKAHATTNNNSQTTTSTAKYQFAVPQYKNICNNGQNNNNNSKWRRYAQVECK